MSNHHTPYKPINCNFHDMLLDLATRKATVGVVYRLEDDNAVSYGQINDVYTKEGEEFLVMEDGIEIRLDFLVSVDGIDYEGFCKAN